MTTESLRNMFCGDPACKDSLCLTRRASHAFGLIGEHESDALMLAATHLGWRYVADEGIRCPFHAQNTACVRCNDTDCSCVGGQRFNARRIQPGER